MAIKHLIFDFDGTLVNSKALVIELYNQLAKQKGYGSISVENMQELKQLSLYQRAKFLRIPIWHIPSLITRMYSSYKKQLTQIQWIDHIPEVLETLHQAGYTLDIVSSNSEENIRLFLESKGCTLFNQIHCSNNLSGKDSVLKKLIKKQKYETAAVVYIGDEQRDIEAAQQAGVQQGWVAWGYDSSELIDALKPSFQFETPQTMALFLINQNP